MNHHVAARSGRHDHRDVAVAEDVDQVARHRARVIPRAGVER
jgi:hypothetical protein